MRKFSLSFAVALLGMVAVAQVKEIPSEPGLYLVQPAGPQKLLGEIVTFRRSGSLLVSSATAGIKTRKENVQLPGPHAATQANSKPVFYFIPAKQEAEAGVNAGDLILIRLEEKKERRQFEIGAQGLWRGSSGISLNRQVQIARSEEQPGVYKVTPVDSLTTGEYALYLPRGHGTEPYVYDFSVSAR